MKKTKFRRLVVMTASLLCCLIFTVPAYAQSNEPQPEATPAPAETEAEPETQNPFTPDGTGTVVDNATDEDGKEFYTITTADESVFYLVIDKQKTSENVYFLNAVTVDDLLPLAEQGEEPAEEVTPEPEPEPTEPVEEVTEPEPEPKAEKTDSPLLSLLHGAAGVRHRPAQAGSGPGGGEAPAHLRRRLCALPPGRGVSRPGLRPAGLRYGTLWLRRVPAVQGKLGGYENENRGYL